jgi:hypothetical protein
MELPIASRTQLYLDYLREQGYGAAVDAEGDIVFPVDGRPYVLFASEPDPGAFRLAVIGAWELDGPGDLARALEACSEVAARSQVAKAFVAQGETVVVTVEQFVADPAHFAAVFPRCLEALEIAVAGLVRRLSFGRLARPMAQA